MDVDAPNILKRCSSAPLINEASSTAATSPTTSTAPRNTPFFTVFSNNMRTRRHSSNFSSLAAPANSINSWGARVTPLTPRVNQLRAEECADVCNTREVAHERELHNTMQMGQSCEDLTLVGGAGPHSPTRIHRSKKHASPHKQHPFTSITRKPAIVPLNHIKGKFSPVVSPSPTRKYTTRRSLSPTIAIRASSFSPVSRPNLLAGKRRGDDADSPLSKRMCTSDRLTPSTPGTPDSDSLECTFRPVSPRAQPMHEVETQGNHKSASPS